MSKNKKEPMNNNRIKEVRLAQHKTQKDLAKLLGVSEQAIAYYEKALREPPLASWVKMADYLDVSVPYLQGVSGAETFAQYLNEKYKLNDNDTYTNKFNDRLKKYFNVFVDSKNVSNKDKILFDTVTSNTLSLLGYMVPIKNTNKADVQRKELKEFSYLIESLFYKIRRKRPYISAPHIGRSENIPYYDNDLLNALKSINELLKDEKSLDDKQNSNSKKSRVTRRKH